MEGDAMFSKLLSNEMTVPHAPVHKEGELYKVVDIHGVEFSLYYGYYEDCDRENPLVEPLPVYPDLKAEPQYTEDGRRIVTRMQDACEHYDGRQTLERECKTCKSFERCAEFFGICNCPKNRKVSDGQ